MDLIEKTQYYKALEILDSEEWRQVDKAAIRDLCLILARKCTPYLGSHGRVEDAFAAFVKAA